jgi:hypothetical protein
VYAVVAAKIEELNDPQQRIILEVRKAGRIHTRDLTRLIARDVKPVERLERQHIKFVLSCIPKHRLGLFTVAPRT